MRAFIVSLDIFLALSGYFGGGRLVKDPTGNSMHMPLAWLKDVPLVKNYFWPGIFLLGAFGLGASMAVVAAAYNYTWWQELNVGLGIVLMAWIVVEVLLIPEKSLIQFIYFILGLLLVILPLL